MESGMDGARWLPVGGLRGLLYLATIPRGNAEICLIFSLTRGSLQGSMFLDTAHDQDTQVWEEYE